MELTWSAIRLSWRRVLPSPVRRTLSIMTGTSRRAPCGSFASCRNLAGFRRPRAASACPRIGDGQWRTDATAVTVMVGETGDETEPPRRTGRWEYWDVAGLRCAGAPKEGVRDFRREVRGGCLGRYAGGAWAEKMRRGRASMRFPGGRR